MSRFFILFIVLMLGAGCGRTERKAESAWSYPEGERLRVAASTTIVGDVVRQVGGDAIDVVVLFPIGADPHDYPLRPRDMALASEADMIVINGGGLEGNLPRMLQAVGERGQILDLSQSLADTSHLRARHAQHHHHSEDGECVHGHEGDPHYWMDPHHVLVWTDTIARALIEQLPEQSDAIMQRAIAYAANLMELDLWIQEEIERIPPEQRYVITDHQMLGHFSLRYGFRDEGSIIRSISTAAQPSAREMATVINTLKRLDARALFVGDTVAPDIAERIARDTGARVGVLLTGSLTDANGPGPDYIAYMKYNVNQLVRTLAQDKT